MQTIERGFSGLSDYCGAVVQTKARTELCLSKGFSQGRHSSSNPVNIFIKNMWLYNN